MASEREEGEVRDGRRKLVEEEGREEGREEEVAEWRKRNGRILNSVAESPNSVLVIGSQVVILHKTRRYSFLLYSLTCNTCST